MSKPNILYIQSDPIHIMGSAGNNIIDTSSLDELAKAGTNFTNAYCNSPFVFHQGHQLLLDYKMEVWTNDQILNSAIPTYFNGYDPVQMGGCILMVLISIMDLQKD